MILKALKLIYRPLRRWTLLIWLLTACGSILLAQPSPEVIKAGGYRWGESRADNEQESINAAKTNLIQKIVQTVSSVDEVNISQELRDDKGKYDSYLQSRSKVASRMQLRGLNVMALPTDRGFSHLAFISEADYALSLKAIADEVIADYSTAESIERTRGLADAISSYYRTYLKTFFSPDVILYDLPTGGKTNIQTWILENKLNAFMRNVSVLADPPTKMDVDVVSDIHSVTVNATYQGKPCQGLVLWKMPRRRSNEVRVLNGKAKLEFSTPELRFPPPYHALVRHEVGYRLSLDAGAPAELREAQVIAKDILIEPVEIEVDYRQIIEVDFNVNRISGNDYTIEVVMNNFRTQSPIVFDYGDNTSETLRNKRTIYTYAKPGKYILKLEAKPLPSVEKVLSIPSGELVAIKKDPIPVPPKPEPTIGVPPPKPTPSPVQANTTGGIAYRKDPEPVSPTPSPNTGTVSPKAATEKPAPLPNAIPSRIAATIELLKGFGVADDLLKELDRQKKQGKLAFGKKDQFLFPERCVVALIDRQSKSVKYLLGAGEERTLNLLTNTPVSPDQLKNLVAIWIEIF